jgi:EAL domain-containing protein (putative c-di-GMP-specific phosphodiesterase class I)
MYAAKAAGRNTYQFFTEELRERTTERLSLIEGLRRALDSSDQLHLVYQPKVDVANQTVIGLEALIRWNHPLIGEVPPSRFVPLAEETDLIIPLGDWVLDHVCLQMKRWLDQGLPPMRVSVNLSSRQFRTGNVVETVGAALAAADLDPRYLDVELTEGTIISDVAQTRRALERLREMGVTVSIDDFGTGYSSLGYLTQLPIDTLKIDRSFIAESLVGPDAGVISSAIIGLAKSLGLEVVAEGVETEEQLAFLQELGCTKVQGFAIARPMPSSKVLDFVAAFDGENQLVRRR